LALLPVVAVTVVLTGVAFHLAGRRDLGAATWPGRESTAPHYALVGGPLRLVIRLARATVLSWLVGTIAFAVLLGTVAESSAADASGDRSVQKALGQLGGHGSAVSAYLGLTFLILALLLALIAAVQVIALRDEEASGHLENLLVRPVSRARWLYGRLLLSAGVLLVAGTLAGAAAWAGAASQHGDVRPGSLVNAGLNLVPPALMLLGLGALAFGAWPRRAAALTYGYLAWSLLVEFTGAVVHISHWVLDTSVFFHMAPAPAANPDWVSAAVLVGLGMAGALAGAFMFGRRDVLGA
jgi:ABC-2 type transport system permease protein